jgi:Transposase, Mutator family
VHLIRHSLKYVPRMEREQVARDLKPIYTAVDADAAEEALERFDEKWGGQFPVITKAWLDAWEYVIPFLAFPDDVRRVIYTTDESVKAAAQFQVPCLSRSPVLVAEVGGCEGVARRQGRRRIRVRMGFRPSEGVRDPRPSGTPFAGRLCVS